MGSAGPIGTFSAGDIVAEPGTVGTFGFGGEVGIALRPLGRLEPVEPQEPNQKLSDAEIQRRIDASKAWDKWVAWNACAHPIWEKYQKQLDQYHGLWGEGVWLQVGVVVAYGGSAVAENVPGMWGAFLLSVGAINKMKAKYNELAKAYTEEATKTCGPEVSKPASHN